MVAISRQVAQHRRVMIVVACGGHEAKCIAGARLLTEIISCPVNREDVKQHHLARPELNVDGLTFIHFTLVDRDPEYQVLATLHSVCSHLLCRMRPRQETQAAVSTQAVKDRDPNRCGCKRLDRRVRGIAVPWRRGTGKRALVKDSAPPKNDVRSDELFDHINDARMSGYVQPARSGPKTFKPATRNMRTH